MFKTSWQSVIKVFILCLTILLFSVGNKIPNIISANSILGFFSDVFVDSAVAIEQLIPKATVSTIASATTVLISNDLEKKGDIEQGESFKNAGSGVIIAKKDNSILFKGKEGGAINPQTDYYVLTNSHVVDQNDTYGIRVSDGDVYRIDNTKIYRFLKKGKNGGEYKGTDLAILKFSSDRDYPVATIGQSADLKQFDPVMLSGWPAPDSPKQKRTRVEIYNNLESRTSPDERGYDISYTANSTKNISGGPVFNLAGQLVAIHGNKPNPNGPPITRGISIEQFLELQRTTNYISAFDAPTVEISNTPNIEAIKFGTKYILSGFNVTPEEYGKLSNAPDVLKKDPAYQAMISLKDKYGCLSAFPDGTLRPSAFQERRNFYPDLNACMDKLNDKISEEYVKTASKESLQEILVSIKSLASQVKSISANVSTPTFFCDTSGQTPTTSARTSNGDRRIMIEWSSKYFNDAGYDPAKRCQAVTEKLQNYHTDNKLNFITSSKIDGSPVICASLTESDAKSGKCSVGLILTLESNQNPTQMLNEFKEALSPDSKRILVKELSESKTKYIDMQGVLQ